MMSKTHNNLPTLENRLRSGRGNCDWSCILSRWVTITVALWSLMQDIVWGLKINKARLPAWGAVAYLKPNACTLIQWVLMAIFPVLWWEGANWKWLILETKDKGDSGSPKSHDVSQRDVAATHFLVCAVTFYSVQHQLLLLNVAVTNPWIMSFCTCKLYRLCHKCDSPSLVSGKLG